jgi:uncharacterized protein (DUF4415 family)
MAKKKAAGSSILDSADDAPELTDAFFAAATVRDGDKVVRRGRPKLAAPKQLVTIRFPAETLGRLRAMGPGWQGGGQGRGEGVGQPDGVQDAVQKGNPQCTRLRRRCCARSPPGRCVAVRRNPRLSHAGIDGHPGRTWAMLTCP